MTATAIHDQLTAQIRRTRNGAPEDCMPLADAIKADLISSGYEISPVVAAILDHHLGLANIAAHVAHEMTTLTTSPLYPLHALPDATQESVARIGMAAAGELVIPEPATSLPPLPIEAPEPEMTP